MELYDMPQIKDWTAHVGAFNLRTFMLANVSIAEAFSVAALLCPEFVEYRDCVFLKLFFDEKIVDSWFGQLKNDGPAVESVVNHIHLWDFFAPASDNENEALQVLAERMAGTWQYSAEMQFPHRRFAVEADNGSGNYGPTVVIYSA